MPLFGKKPETEQITLLKTQNNIEMTKLEGTTSAKEVASKYIGKTAIPWIVLLVVVGVVSSAFLSIEALPAVIGLVSTAVMAMIGMLTNITGTKEKEEKPEIKIIQDLIKTIDEPMTVEINNDNVTITKGNNSTTMGRGTGDKK